MASATKTFSGSKGKTSEERAAEVEALAEQLNEGVAALTTSEAWLGMLRVSARFTRYRGGRSSRTTCCCCGCRPSSAA